MASEQSLANKAYWEAAAAQGPLAPEAVIEGVDIRWTPLSGEPGGVDYLEVDAGGIRAMWVRPKGAADDRVIFYAHGGGFVSGSIYTHRKMVGHLAKAAGCRALLFEYPYAHAQKHPAQLNAAVAAYRWLLAEGIAPMHIAAAGDSAGAILTFGLLQQARNNRTPLPAAVMILSGWLDLALSAPSFETNREKDAFFTRDVVEWLASNFLGDGDPRDPLASPLYAKLKGFPPIFLQAGGDEALVDESRMFAERAGQAGVEVRLDVFPDMLHSFQMMAGRAPEADDAIQRLADWVQAKLGIDPMAGEGA
ncbi:alpha/beta hydrolase [Rhizobium sp.]|uniref:alpha/beta hydrolase n=1 Tax=Rhizobium sp. TaxID=391 RepID=UPI0034C647A7